MLQIPESSKLRTDFTCTSCAHTHMRWTRRTSSSILTQDQPIGSANPQQSMNSPQLAWVQLPPDFVYRITFLYLFHMFPQQCGYTGVLAVSVKAGFGRGLLHLCSCNLLLLYLRDIHASRDLRSVLRLRRLTETYLRRRLLSPTALSLWPWLLSEGWPAGPHQAPRPALESLFVFVLGAVCILGLGVTFRGRQGTKSIVIFRGRHRTSPRRLRGRCSTLSTLQCGAHGKRSSL